MVFYIHICTTRLGGERGFAMTFKAATVLGCGRARLRRQRDDNNARHSLYSAVAKKEEKKKKKPTISQHPPQTANHTPPKVSTHTHTVAHVCGGGGGARNIKPYTLHLYILQPATNFLLPAPGVPSGL